MDSIGRLQIEARVGSGSFASVWLAYDPDLDSRVAVKVLAENWAQDPDVRARFVEEARVLRRLEHTRIARVYAIDTLDDGRPYLVMEYADRGSLHDRIATRHSAGRGFSVDEATSIGLELADCVFVAHDLGVIHRDLKPSNILYRTVPPHHQAALRRRGLEAPAEQMLLVDFGLARKFQAFTQSTVAAGTPYYMAPEQAEGRADARVDVYACGAILYQLLAGEVPFPYSSIGEVIRHQLTDGPPSILERRKDIDPQLARLIDSSLTTDPADRPRSIAEWADGLSRVQATFRPTPMASSPGAVTPVTKAVDRLQPEPPDFPPADKRKRSSSQPPTEISQERHLPPGLVPPGPEPDQAATAASICGACGHENPPDFQFCGECGTPLPQAGATRCPACGQENPSDFLFCGECAARL